MIFGTVGSHPEGFPRLVEALDRVAAEVDERVLVQIGHTASPPARAEHVRFASMPEFGRHVEAASVVVCHAGVGSIVHALRHRKPTVVFPRLPEHREVLDDHQVRTAVKLAEAGYVRVARDADELLAAVLERRPPQATPGADGLIPRLRHRVAALAEGRR